MNVGSAWKKESKDGKKYMSCVMQSPFLPDGEINFAIFPVQEKKSENAPDYVIVWSPRKKEKSEPEAAQNDAPVPSDDDIPF